MSQKELADILFVNQTAVSQWETGRHFPDMAQAIKIADFFKVTTDYIFGRDNPPPAQKNAPPQSRSAMEDEFIERLEILSPDEQREALGYLDYLVHRRSNDAKAP